MNFKPSKEYRFSVIKKSVFLEKYILLSVTHDQVFQGTLFIGPTLLNPLSEDRVSGIINDFRAFFYREKVFHYYNSLPVIGPTKLKNISVFVYYLFFNELLSTNSVMRKTSELPETSDKIKNLNLAVSEKLQSNEFHNNHLFEKRILYIVREGRVEDLKELSFLQEEEGTSLLSKSSYLRSMKNHIITLITHHLHLLLHRFIYKTCFISIY